MKQATLKAAGTAVLGVAIAAVAAGTASAAGAGGLGLPTTLANPEVAGTAATAATGAVNKVPGGGEVTEAVGTLGVASPLTPAPAAEAPVADGMRAAGANRVGGLESVPGGQGLSKTPVGGVIGTISSLGGAPGAVPGIG
ncbi:hypothetical protein OG871_15890 [Kitasatospora sp. NBC_00374]|uniref:hypothetical protein n=1 Tax=Kitasatospora sp. NBC_00374 TaxID=2975964 RepID=UPI0030E2AB83